MKRGLLATRMEAGFDVLYLLAAVSMGCALLFGARSKLQTLFGAMALLLAAGDAFHLVPRVLLAPGGGAERFRRPLGIGKLVASVSMTIFYVLLWHAGLICYAPPNARGWTALMYALALVRAALCLLPQNGWTQPNPPAEWNLYRNVPFTLLGLAVAGLFFAYRGVALPWMWLAILMSFAFYLPVALGAAKRPALGMLMLPKTLCYVWIIAMGFSVA